LASDVSSSNSNLSVSTIINTYPKENAMPTTVTKTDILHALYGFGLSVGDALGLYGIE